MPSTHPFHLTAVKFISLIKCVGQYELWILQLILSAYFVSVFVYLTLRYQVHTPHRERAVPWHRSSVAELSLWEPGFSPGPVRVQFVVEKVEPEQIFTSYFVIPSRCHVTNAPYIFCPVSDTALSLQFTELLFNTHTHTHTLTHLYKIQLTFFQSAYKGSVALSDRTQTMYVSKSSRLRATTRSSHIKYRGNYAKNVYGRFRKMQFYLML